MDLGQVDPDELIQQGPDVETELVAPLASSGSRLGQWLARRGFGRHQVDQHGLDLRVAFVDASLVEVVQGQRLLQGKYVLRPVIAHQCRAHRRERGLAAAIAHRSQYVKIALASHDRPNNSQAGRPGDVTDDVVQL